MDINISEDKTPSLPLGISEATLAGWRHQYQEVFFIRLKVPNVSEEIGAWMKTPDLDIIKLVQDTAKKHGELQALEQLYINCQLKASPEIDRYPKYKMSLLQQLEVLLKTYEAEVVKY